MRFVTKFNFTAALPLVVALASCSNDFADMQSSDEPVDQKGYYYNGNIVLSKAEDDSKVYVIRIPMMYPMLYGYTIPVPVPDYASRIVVKMGEGTVVEKQSVKITAGGKETVEDMPAEGTMQYVEGFSVTRISQDEYSVEIDPQDYLQNYDDVRIAMTPIPYMAFDDSADATQRSYKFESPDDFGLPAEIDLQFLPYTFTDNYRPIRQYHLYTY